MKHHVYILAFSFCILQSVDTANAQIGNCETGMAEAMLEGGNVRARILNNGGLFWRGSPHIYEAPIDLGVSSIFVAGIWIGGHIDGELRTAATRYGPWEFWPGPLDDAGNPPDDCTLYDHIWEITSSDILDFLNDGIVSQNLATWPWHLGAPVIDGDGNPDNYNLNGGDLPELFGDQRLWWIMNDRGNTHESSSSEPIGLEIHASAFAFKKQGPLGNFTFYDYQIINKNTSPFEDIYFGFFSDVDLGNFDDDYVGSDSLLHLGYVYNANPIDTGCGIDIIPPAAGFTFLETIVADDDGLDNDRDGESDEPGEMLGTTAMLNYYGGGGVTGDPVTGEDYYNYMQSRWKDGQLLTIGGYGRDLSSTPTRFSFPGDPLTKSYWSEFNYDNKGNALQPHDKRFVTSTGKFDIASGDTTQIRLAIVWSQGEDHLDSVRLLKSHTASVRNAGNDLFAPNLVTSQTPEPVEAPPLLGFGQNFPNPFTQFTTISYDLPKPMQVRLAVYDMLGREVNVLVNTHQQAGNYAVDFDAENLPAGVYIARIEFDLLQFTQRMILMR